MGRPGNGILASMDLYILPFSGSFPVHVACLEAGAPITLHYVDRKTKRLDDGSDYFAVTDTGNVPALRLPDGEILTESVAVLQYVADSVAESGLAPRAGTKERYRLIEWLNFISTEVHKLHLWTIFGSSTTPAMKEWARASLPALFDVIERRLVGREFVLGERFTVADAYLFWALLVAPYGGVALDRWPGLSTYAARIRDRPSVQRAIAIEAPLYAREQSAA